MEEPSLHSKDDVIVRLCSEDPKPDRIIDYVLVYERCPEDENKDEESKERAEVLEIMREEFEKSLSKAGLILEYHKIPDKRRLDLMREIKRQIDITRDRAAGHGETGKQLSKDPKITRHFVLIHAPWEVLAKHAEEMHVKVPFKKNDVVIKSWMEKTFGGERMKSLRKRNPLVVHDTTFEDKEDYFMANFRQDSFNKFINYQNKERFFDKSDRVYIVQQICYRASFGSTDPADVGLRKMILSGAYVAGYPLHDGPDHVEPEKQPTNDRQRLRCDWSRPGRSFKYQPQRAIKDYFGSEIALYFAWVGFYTAMLVPLAFIGLIVFLYGIGSAGSHIPVRDVCDEKNKGLWYMCPLCDKKCSFWDLTSTTCRYAYFTYFFDNDGTVALAVIASIWATLFLEFWKRQQAILAHEWHTDRFEEDEEPLRPEFPAEYLKRNPLTEKMEPYVPKLTLYSRYGGVISIILTMVMLVIAAVVGVIIYRAAVFASLSGHSDSSIQARAKIITSATAGFLNLVAINLMKLIYNKLAVWLTDWENPPTRTAYEDSFTWKMYMFQFVNTYASVFYIAFFKSGHMIGTPGRYNRVADKFRMDGCSEQGCFLELCVQLLILMVGQQIIGLVMDIALPYLMYWIKTHNRQRECLEDFQRDFVLNPLRDHFIFWEYLQVVLQYGFATMFVAAFPLGPFFALFTSVIRIRAGAFNLVSQFRRPDFTHAEDIGVWYRILKALRDISILVNAFRLAFTSEFIPKLLYRLKYAPDHDSPGGGTLTGYINNSLSSIHTVDIFRKEPGTEPENPHDNLSYNNSVCRYHGYHENFWPYNFSKQHWEVTAVRLAFVFVFQFTVYFISNLITKLVPAVPKDFALKTKREKELIKSVFEKKQEVKETQTDGAFYLNTKTATGSTSEPTTLTTATNDSKQNTAVPSDTEKPTVHRTGSNVTNALSSLLTRIKREKRRETQEDLSEPATVAPTDSSPSTASEPATVAPTDSSPSTASEPATVAPTDSSPSTASEPLVGATEPRNQPADLQSDDIQPASQHAPVVVNADVHEPPQDEAGV